MHTTRHILGVTITYLWLYSWVPVYLIEGSGYDPLFENRETGSTQKIWRNWVDQWLSSWWGELSCRAISNQAIAFFYVKNRQYFWGSHVDLVKVRCILDDRRQPNLGFPNFNFLEEAQCINIFGSQNYILLNSFMEGFLVPIQSESTRWIISCVGVYSTFKCVFCQV